MAVMKKVQQYKHTTKAKRPAWNKGLEKIAFELDGEVKGELEEIAKVAGLPLWRVINAVIANQARNNEGTSKQTRKSLPKDIADDYRRVEEARLQVQLLSPAGKGKLLPFLIGITPETKAKLEQIARQQGVSVTMAATTLINSKIAENNKLVEKMREEAKEMVQKEYDRFLEIVARMVEPNNKLLKLLSEFYPGLKENKEKN